MNSKQKKVAGAIALLTFVFAGSATAHAEKSGVRPNVISVPSGPGTISGLGEQFEPTLNTGSATYKVALDVPPGTAGFAPSLSLRYDSGQGVGIVGMGWSLDVGAIQRQTAYGVPQYGASDRFVWEGQELVPMGGGVFRLKIEGAFLRFRQSADHWEADGRDGTTYRFGVSSAARSGGAARTFRWALEEIVDVSGNRVAFSYDADRGQLYLARIDYNLRPGAARNAVEIGYEPRPDVLTDFRAGFSVTTARRLKRIKMIASGGQVRRYELDYQTATAVSALSKLARVTMYGTDDRTSLPVISFGYTAFDPAQQKVQSIANPPALSLRDGNTELADFDGDGLPDLVRAALGRHEVAINDGGTAWAAAIALRSNPSVQLSASGTELADLDGDGIVDLLSKLAPGTGDFVFFPNRGTGDWGSPARFRNNPAFSFEDPGVRMIDFDGDGLVDVMQTTPTRYYYWRNNGDGSWGEPLGGAPIAGQAISFSDPAVRLADMNGDRLVDLVYLRTGSIVYWPNLGWGKWGEAGLVGGAPDAGAADQGRVSLGDMNGDGLADAWLAVGTELRLWLQRGDGRFAEAIAYGGLPDANPLTTVVRVADMNGSGTADVVWHQPNAAADRAWSYLDLTGGVRPNLLTTIENGLGRTIEIQYSSSGAMFRMAAAAGRPWATRLPIATQVVGTVTTSDGRGWSKQEAFVYRDGYYDGATRQFRGFGETTRIEPGNDEEATSIQIHRFDVGAGAEALKGVELGVEVQTAERSVLVRETSTYEVRDYGTGTDGRRVTGANRRSHQVDHVEGTTTPVSTLEEWSYDAYGDVLVHSEWGVVDGADRLAGTDERITTTDYAHDLERWLLGRPYHVTITDGSGRRLTESRTYYDGEPFVGLPLGALGARGFPTRTSSWVEDDHFIDTTRVQHDAFGLQTATLDPRGFRREVDYDPDTHRFVVAERSFLDGGRSLTFTAAHDPVTGTLSWYTDPTGRKTSFQHTPLLQLAAIARPGDSGEKPSVAFEYVYGDPVSKVISRSRVEIGGDAVIEKHHYYDGLGRDLGLVEQAEDGKTITSGLKIFGPNGRVVRELEPAFGVGFELGTPEGGRAFSAHRYDALGRRLRTVLPDGSATETRFRPLVVEHWDAEDLDPRSLHRDTPRVDHLNQFGVARVDERLGSQTLTTHFQRDALGRIAEVIDAARNATSYDFDGVGRVRALTHPDAGRTTTVYDDAGNPTLRKDARGATVGATYDALGRPLTETLTDATGQLEGQVTYHYDTPSPKFPDDPFSAGELTWVEDAAGVEYFRHDERDHLTETIRVTDGKEYRIALEHDGVDRLAQVTYPDGRQLDYQYNERGLLRRVSGILNDVDYDAQGLATIRQYANGAVSTAHYDALDRLDRLATTSSGRTLQSMTFGYDRVGNVASIMDAAHAVGPLAGTRSFTYDSLYRLRTAGGVAGRWSYDFDDGGNWKAKSDVGAYTYASKPHQPATAGGGSYDFDEAGQMTVRPGSTQTYDAKGRLASVTLENGTVVRYRYDYTGAVAIKETAGPRGGHRTVYIDKLAEERDGELVDYVFAGGLRIARVGGEPPGILAAGLTRLPRAAGTGGMLALLCAAMLTLFGASSRRRLHALASLGLVLLVFNASCAGCSGGETLMAPGISGAIYYHQDNLQSVALQTDQDGFVATEASYDPFGAALQSSTEPYAFTGKERDPDTGLYHFGARAHDPKLGLFLSPDPAILEDPSLAIEDPQLLSVYSYARNNPTTHIDPDGRLPHILGGALVGALLGGGVYLAKAAYNGQFSGRALGAAVASGAVAGAITAATAGAGLLVSGATSSMYGGVVQRAIETRSLSKALDPKAIALDGALGAASSALAAGAKAVAPKVVGAVKTVVARGRALAKGGQRNLGTPKGLSDEVDAAFASGQVKSGTLVQGSAKSLGGSGPKQGQGAIWYHDNVSIGGVGPGGSRVNLRTHAPNPKAPDGAYSQSNYTTQVSTGDGRYLLPDGSWKTIANMTNAERTAAHYPAGN